MVCYSSIYLTEARDSRGNSFCISVEIFSVVFFFNINVSHGQLMEATASVNCSQLHVKTLFEDFIFILGLLLPFVENIRSDNSTTVEDATSEGVVFS